MTKDQLVRFRLLLVDLNDDCPLRDLELCAVGACLFQKDLITVVGGRQLKKMASTLDYLREVIVENGMTSMADLLDHYDRKRREMRDYIGQLSEMSTEELIKEGLARRERMERRRQSMFN
jgi:hypothetical protein